METFSLQNKSKDNSNIDEMVKIYCSTIRETLENIDKKYDNELENKENIFKELQKKRDEGKRLTEEIELQDDRNINYKLNISGKDILLELDKNKAISLVNALADFTNRSNRSIGFIIKNKYSYFRSNRFSNDELKSILDIDTEEYYKFPKNIITVKPPREGGYLPLDLLRIAHELGHAFYFQKNNLYLFFKKILYKDKGAIIYDCIIEQERMAHAFAIKFIRYIEKKYNINTHALDCPYYKIPLSHSQMKYILNKHIPNREGLNKSTVYKQKSADKYKNKHNRKFL